eukprot:6186088-Pleurochrysis_carterae.AAC.1
MHPDPRITRRHTPKRASGNERAPKATAPSGVEATVSLPPAALETSRPNGRRSEGARIFWYGPPSFRAPGRLICRYRLRR